MSKFRRSRDKFQDTVRVNHRIRTPEVRLIDDEGNQLGVIAIKDALKLAFEKELDLVELAPNAKPPVCKIIDYGKYKYQIKKKQHEAKKKQVQIQVKEVKLTPKTEEHDFNFKIKHIERFLADGNKAKVTIRFKGRELMHKELGRQVLDKIIEVFKESAELESPPKMEGRNMTMMLTPKTK